MKRIILTVIFLGGGILFLDAQNIDRGFRQLGRERLDRAQSTFQAVLSDGDVYERPAASYGLARVYSHEEYHGYDLQQSLEHSLNAVKLFEGLDASHKDKARQIVSEEDMMALLESLDNKYLDILTTDPSRQQLEQYLKTFAGAPGQQQVIALRDSLAWLEAKGFNTVYAYERYVKKFPESAYADSAKYAVVRLKYEQALKQEDTEAMRKIMEKYPHAHYAEKAKQWLEESEYKRAITLNSVDYYNRFLKAYPQSDKAEEIRKRRDEKAFEMTAFLNTAEAYNNFLESYPNAAQAQTAREKRNKLAFEQAKKKNTAQALQHFILSYPNAPQQGKAQELLMQFSISPQLISKQNEQDKMAQKGIKQIKQFADKNMEQLLRDSRYDEYGRLVFQVCIANGEKQKTVYTYENDEHGYPAKEEVFHGDSLGLVKAYETDENRNLHAVSYQGGIKGEHVDYKVVYLYDHQFHLSRKVKVSGEDTLELVEVSTNAMGRITGERGYTLQEGKSLKYRNAFSYTSGGQLAEAVYRDGNNEVTKATTYTYDNGRKIAKKVLAKDSSHRKEWEYNEQGEKVSATITAIPDEIVTGFLYYKYIYH